MIRPEPYDIKRDRELERQAEIEEHRVDPPIKHWPIFIECPHCGGQVMISNGSSIFKVFKAGK